MVTRLLAERSGNRGSIPSTKTKIFLNSASAINFLVVSTGIKRPEGETDCSFAFRRTKECMYLYHYASHMS